MQLGRDKLDIAFMRHEHRCEIGVDCLVADGWKQRLELAHDPALAAIEKGEPGRDVGDRHRLAVERSGLPRGLAGQLPDRSGEHTAPACFVAMNRHDERLQFIRRFHCRA